MGSSIPHPSQYICRTHSPGLSSPSPGHSEPSGRLWTPNFPTHSWKVPGSGSQTHPLPLHPSCHPSQLAALSQGPCVPASEGTRGPVHISKGSLTWQGLSPSLPHVTENSDSEQVTSHRDGLALYLTALCPKDCRGSGMQKAQRSLTFCGTTPPIVCEWCWQEQPATHLI